ncbi:hypothetical protein, partial [Acinetobacter baumannii]|uniref:hypothetical protein n=1 Tax=Acinetobacter baumannii TaxID=470 RepID=UPI000B080286
FVSWLRLRECKQTHQQMGELAECVRLSVNVKPANYENLHRVFLTGVVSFIANKSYERKTFMAVRQQKAKVFPASTLHKSN